MSASLLRGLHILEMLRAEPLGVSELARRLGVDKAGVSRVMRSLLAQGWVERTGRLHVLGPRALLLNLGARTTPLLGRAGEVARDLCDQTGHTALVMQMRNHGPQPLAYERSQTTPVFEEPQDPFEHLWTTASGLALLAQLPPRDIECHLDTPAWPAVDSGAPSTPDEVRTLLEQLRSGETVVETSWTVPGLGSVAMPWRSTEATGLEGSSGHGPIAIALLGPDSVIARDRQELSKSLRAATETQDEVA